MITKLTTHDNHRVKVYRTRNNFVHCYSLRCEECNKHIQWLSSEEGKLLINSGVEMGQMPWISVKELGI